MKFSVTGMTCAACVARVEKAVNNVQGVNQCSVSLLTNSMMVEGEVSVDEIVAAVEKSGYGCNPVQSKKQNPDFSEGESSVQDSTVSLEKDQQKEISGLKNRLISSLVFLTVLMYFSMGPMAGLKFPSFLTGRTDLTGALQMMLALVIMIINKRFFVNGFKTFLHLSPTMDTLVALGSGISFVYSGTILLLAPQKHLYFESAAMIVTLITVGKLLEAVSKGRTTNALKSLMKLSPKKALVEHDGKQIEVEAGAVKAGDIFILKPGMAVPVDGIVIEGASTVDESAITGESVPVEKSADSIVTCGTMNLDGFVKCRATKVGSETTLAQIIALVSDAAGTKAPIARIADRVSGVFVPFVIILSAVVFAVWLFMGLSLSESLNRAISVLVVSCPCALGLATPVAIMVASGKGARNGILFKTSATLETLGRIKFLALDKTGTITTGKMKVVSINFLDGQSGNFVAVALSSLPLNAPLPSVTAAPGLQSLLQDCADLESSSEHPVAKSVVDFCNEHCIKPQQVSEFKATGGRGVECRTSDNLLAAGNLDFIKEKCSLSGGVLNAVTEKTESLASAGQTPLIFARNGRVSLILGVADTLKDDSALAIERIKKMGIKPVMITGDNELTARTIANQAKIDSVIAGVLPDQKAQVVKEIMAKGKTAMVGDGINDSVALVTADCGVAVGSGTDVAIDSADVVLMNSSLMDVAAAIKLSRRTLLNIKENLFWAFFYNVALIPVAAGCYAAFGLTLNPMMGAAAMSISSFCVVSNSLRLNLIKLKEKLKAKEKKNMTKEIKVEGMMCQHCEKHVKEALEKIDGVTGAVPSHEKANVVLELSKEVSEADLEKAVTDAGYTFVK